MKIAIIGTFQVGKSTLTNCLIENSLAEIGIGLPTTHALNYYRSGKNFSIFCHDVNGRCVYQADLADKTQKIDIPKETVRVMYSLTTSRNLGDNVLIDTPGLDSIGRDQSKDTLNTTDIIKDDSVHLLILVVPNRQLDDSIRNQVLPLIKESNKRVIVLMNCNQLGSADPMSERNQNMAKQLDRELEIAGLNHCRVQDGGHSKVLPCNAVWWWIATNNSDFYNKQTKDIFRERQQQISNYFTTIQRVSVPNNKELKERSNLAPLFDYLNSADRRDELLLDLKGEFRESIKRLKRELCPIGTIQAFAFDRVPEGWLPCDGRLLSQKIYPDLFKAIGTTFGSGGTGSGQFNIPNLCGRFIRGWASTGVVDPNRRFGSIQEDALQGHGHEVQPSETDYSGEHTHRVRYRVYKVGSNSFSENDMPVYEIPASSDYKDYGNDPGTDEDGWHSHDIPPMIADDIVSTNRTTVRVANETRPANVALRYCIKALDC